MNVQTNHFVPDIMESWIVFKGPSLTARPKLPENAPLASLMLCELADYEKVGVASGHDVRKMFITKGEDEGQIVYFKKCDSTYPPILAQIEAASSASYRITRLECAAKVVPVVDDSGHVIGTASYEIPNFEPLDRGNLSASMMLKMGVTEELVARFVRMEDDLHPGNMGRSKDAIVGIDFDMTWYRNLTSEIKGPRYVSNGYFAPLPNDAFPITENDIENFPDIHDAQPCHWPTKSPSNRNWRKEFNNRKEFQDLAKEPPIIPLKYFAFLKELLIDPTIQIKIMEPYFSKSQEGEDMIKRLNKIVEDRWNELEESLINNKGFRKFIIEQETAFRNCLEHFDEYNRKIALDRVVFEHANLKERFHRIVKKCMVKDFTMAIYDLGCRFKLNGSRWETSSPMYHKLIDIFTIFNENECDLPTAFALLEFDLNPFALETGVKSARSSELIKTFQLVLDNYRGLISKDKRMPPQSMMLEYTPGRNIESRVGALNVELCLAKALKEFLGDPKCQYRVIAIAQKCLQDYAPLGHEYQIGILNPRRIFRQRSDEIKALISDLRQENKDQTPILIEKFLDHGSWNQRGYLSEPSANVILVSQLCVAAIEEFKTQLSLKQLRNHDLIEVCYAVERKNWNLEDSSQKIYDCLKTLKG